MCLTAHETNFNFGFFFFCCLFGTTLIISYISVFLNRRHPGMEIKSAMDKVRFSGESWMTQVERRGMIRKHNLAYVLELH